MNERVSCALKMTVRDTTNLLHHLKRRSDVVIDIMPSFLVYVLPLLISLCWLMWLAWQSAETNTEPGRPYLLGIIIVVLAAQFFWMKFIDNFTECAESDSENNEVP